MRIGAQIHSWIGKRGKSVNAYILLHAFKRVRSVPSQDGGMHLDALLRCKEGWAVRQKAAINTVRSICTGGNQTHGVSTAMKQAVGGIENGGDIRRLLPRERDIEAFRR